MPGRDVEATRTAGRYTLYDQIGGGGMATVHLARFIGPVGFGKTVAIKRMHPDFARDPEFVEMFVDEARLAARVYHPNVVQTLDVVSARGELFLVLEHIHGAALSRLLRAPVPAPIAVAIGCGLLHGLHAAHEATDERAEPLDIVHRDVSPHNVLVGVDGVARVFDFGIAKATGRQHATREGTIKGKFAYMAPEQVTNVRVTRQCDVFAASIVIWEMLTGTRLFRAETEDATLARVLTGRIPPPSTVLPSISPDVDAVVMKGLERDVERRYATARDMARDLERLPRASQSEIGEWVTALAGPELGVRAERIAAIESGRAGEDESGTRMSLVTETDTPQSKGVANEASSPKGRARERRRLAILIAASLLSMAAGGAIVALRPSKRIVVTTPPPAAPTAAPPSATETASPVTTPTVEISDPAPTTEPSHQAVIRLRPRPSSTSAASASAAPIDCNPPSYVGPDGRTHYKVECFK